MDAQIKFNRARWYLYASIVECNRAKKFTLHARASFSNKGQRASAIDIDIASSRCGGVRTPAHKIFVERRLREVLSKTFAGKLRRGGAWRIVYTSKVCSSSITARESINTFATSFFIFYYKKKKNKKLFSIRTAQ